MAAWVMMALLAASATQGVVVKPVANMYSRPNDDAAVVSQAIYASNVTLVEEQAGWAKVRTADDYTGWIPLASLKRLAANGPLYVSTGRVARVASLFANIYREADVTKHQPMVTVPFETRLEVIESHEAQGRWLPVRLPDDRQGWLQRGDVTLDLQPLAIVETIALSRRFLGLPYFWGGA